MVTFPLFEQALKAFYDAGGNAPVTIRVRQKEKGLFCRWVERLPGGKGARREPFGEYDGIRVEIVTADEHLSVQGKTGADDLFECPETD